MSVPQPRVDRPTAHTIATLWGAFSIAAGVVEVGTVGFRAFVLDDFVLVGAHVVWMAPLSYLLFTAPAALVAWLAVKVAPAGWARPGAVFVVGMPPALGVLFLAHPRIHALAILVLAIGVCVQLARVVAPRVEQIRARAARATLAVGAMVALAGVGVGAGAHLGERSEVADLAEARSGAPNILLLILDTVRASSLSVYGHERATTPHLEELAEEGVVFDNAFSTAPWTLTSHVSLFTGRYPFETTATWTTPLDETHPTLAQALANRGYLTAGFVANLLYTQSETGLARGFQRYEDFRVSVAEIGIASSLGRIFIQNPRLRAIAGWHDIPGRRTADEITQRFLDWLGPEDERPFFAFLNYYDAHEPYLPIEPYASRFSTGTPRDNRLIRQANTRSADRIAKGEMTAEEREEEERAYEGGIAWIDDEIGRLLDELEARGVLENTIVVVSSDHGELFGEHGLFAHGGELYTQVLRVPLLVAGPGVARGTRVETAVSLTDVAATLLGLVDEGRGTEPRTAEAFDPRGRSLAGLWRSDPDATRSVVFSEVEPARNQPPGLPSEAGPMKSVVRFPWHYIVDGAGREELYDLSVDPEEFDDLSDDPAVADVLQGLRETTSQLASGGADGGR